jgi:hypothetical protein
LRQPHADDVRFVSAGASYSDVGSLNSKATQFVAFGKAMGAENNGGSWGTDTKDKLML